MKSLSNINAVHNIGGGNVKPVHKKIIRKVTNSGNTVSPLLPVVVQRKDPYMDKYIGLLERSFAAKATAVQAVQPQIMPIANNAGNAKTIIVILKEVIPTDKLWGRIIWGMLAFCAVMGSIIMFLNTITQIGLI
jgi:hypothetical protein